MTKKIYFLLAFLLTTIGGGNFALAAEYVLSFPNIKIQSSTPNGSNYDYTVTFYNGLVITYTRESGKNLSSGSSDCIKYSDSRVYSVSGIPNTEVITSIAFYGYSNNSGKTSTLYLNDVITGNTFSYGSNSEHTLSDLSLVGGFSFKAVGAETGLKITITTDDRTIDNIYSDSYPYKWDFTVEAAKWSKSKSQMINSGWNFADTDVPANGTHDEARPASPASNTEYNIDIIKGLHFTTLDAGSLCLDWKNRVSWLNGTVTLPALLRGHTVKIKSSAVPTAVAEGLTRMTSEETAGVYVYRATQAVASPSFTFDGQHIFYIEVSRTTIQLTYNNSTSAHLRGATPTLTLGTTNQYWGNYAFNVIPGIDNTEYTATSLPSGILEVRYLDGKYMANNGGSTGYNYLTLTGTTTGTANITVTISPAGEHAFDIVGPYEFDVRVVQNAVPTKWEFDNTSIWTTATAAALGADGTNWQSGTAANEYQNKNKINGAELYVGETKMTETAGLYITAEKGAIQVNPTEGYVRIGNASRANIVIPNAVAEQTVTFKVKTATAGKDCGIQAASSNLALISGCVAGDVSYYTFRVTSNGDIKFTQTSSDTDLFIYYIDLKADTPANTGLKFVNGSDDISNTKVNIVSGVTGPLDSYFTLANGGSVDWANVTVTVSPLSLITYDNDGTFTMGSGTGTATITARTESSPVETGIAVLYVSVKAQPTVQLSANGPFSVNYGQDFNGGTSTVTGTSSVNLPVKYKSSNERVATVDASGHVTSVGVGTTTITAYTEETNKYLPAEASYQLTYNAGNVIFQFEPSEVKLALGKNITPYLHYDQKGQLDASTLTSALSKSGVVTCEVVTDAKQSDKKVIKITSVNDASKIGETVIVTASATMKNSSVVYNTTIAVTITAADACNFDWVNSSDIYIYEDTYLPIPRIAGNATGNNHFSNSDKNGGNGDASGNIGKNYRTEPGSNYKYYWEGGNHFDPLHAYVYEIKGNLITWNNNSSEKTNYHLNEGVPDFYLTDANNAATDKGYILWAKSDNNAYGDTLLVYAKTEGIIKLHAKDSQNDTECTPITIHIMPKSTIYGSGGELETQINTISFPYTWDFTSNEDLSALDNSIYWDKENNNYYNAPLTMNVNFADGQNNGLTNAKTHLAFLGATSNGEDHHILPWFKGLKIQLGNSTYNSKIHKIRISPYTSPGNSRLYLSGGTHTITLPHPGYNNPATGFYEPESYKVFIKLHTTGSTEVELKAGNSNDSYKSFVKDGTYTRIDANSDVILSKTVARGEQVSIGLADCNIYWIAMSTEEKRVNPHPTSGMRAATYSYGEDLNCNYSGEANPGLKAYVASSFSSNSVNLTEAPATVKSGTGLVLKSTSDEGSYSSCYMIACGKNLETYSSPAALTESQNYLKPSVAGQKIQRFEGTEGQADRYTNFLLSKTYVAYDENTGQNTTESGPTTGWLFLRVNGESAVAPANMSYLHVPGTLRVINTNYSAARRAGEEDDKPASKNMLFINFIDDPDDLGTTDISAVSNDGVAIDNDAWYTLQGVRVNAPTKGGIYIHNGRKVVIK